VIYSVNQQPVSGVEKLREVLAQLTPGSPVVLQVERGGALRFVVLEPE
jgi:S1-C subfamily serine protease